MSFYTKLFEFFISTNKSVNLKVVSFLLLNKKISVTDVLHALFSKFFYITKTRKTVCVCRLEVVNLPLDCGQGTMQHVFNTK